MTAVEPREYSVRLAGGGRLRYDALVVAVGALQAPWLDGALTFRGGADAEVYRALLEELAAGAVSHVLFAGPPGVSWTLPLYELALLTRDVGGRPLRP